MKYEHKFGTVALALALLGGACSTSSSGSSPSGGSSTSSSKASSGSAGSSGSGSGGSSSSKAGASGGQSSSSSSKAGSGGSSSSSANPGTCGASVTPCTGDVTGTWNVTSGCLDLNGEFATRGTGLGCNAATVTGSVQVTGSFIVNADKKWQDKTTTKGPVTVNLVKDCLYMSGTWTQCDLISVAIEGLGFKDVKCVDADGGGCTCPAMLDHPGTMGLIVAEPELSGTYTIDGTTLNTGENPLTGAALEYSFCAKDNKLTLTPKTSSPPTTGTVVLQKGGCTGSTCTGGNGGNSGNSGTGGNGGTTTSTGTTTSGGITSGGTSSKGGTTVTGGSTATGGATGGTTTSSGTGGGGGGGGTDLPCDILEKASSPCVGAYSMVRAIYKDYKGPAYQVRSKTSTTSTKDVELVDGYANAKTQDDFCASGGCTVSKIFDQSPKGNHLILSPDTFWLSKTGTVKSGGCRQNETDIKTNPKISVNGKPAYGLRFTGGQGNAYRVIKPTGTAVADEAEYMYSIFDTTVYNGQCCNDFGSAETTGNPDSFTSMEAIYYGNATMWGKGGGNGPWFSCDYEAVISPGSKKVDTSIPSFPTDKIKKFATFILKGYSGGKIALKYGDSTQGPLTVQYDGARADGVKTMKKQGSILLGTGGDGSAWSNGVWFEGAITKGCSEDKAVDDAIQASIVAAKFSAQ